MEEEMLEEVSVLLMMTIHVYFYITYSPRGPMNNHIAVFNCLASIAEFGDLLRGVSGSFMGRC